MDQHKEAEEGQHDETFSWSDSEFGYINFLKINKEVPETSTQMPEIEIEKENRCKY